MTEPEQLKCCANRLCDRKGQLLALTEFHNDRSRKDGRAPICKQCKSRQAQEVWQARKDPEIHGKPSVRVYFAIEKGSRTWEEIEIATGLHEDVISDALAELWDRNQVRVVAGQYYPLAA